MCVLDMQAKRAPAPKGCSNLRDQIIKSRKTWKKMKAMDGNQSVNENVSHSKTMQKPPTQSSQNPAAQRKEQQGQSSSEWAGF